MRLYWNLEVATLVDGIYAEKELVSVIDERAQLVISEREKILRAEYPTKNDRALTMLIRALNSPDTREAICKDIINDKEYRKLLGIKIIRRNNKEIVVHKYSYVFMVREEKVAPVYNRASVIR